MSGPQEVELKLRLINPGDDSSLLNDPLLSEQYKTEQVRVNQYTTTYYDTPDRALAHSGYSYRIRKAADGYTATVKDQGSQGGGLFIRGEWNVKVSSQLASIEPFRSLPVGGALEAIAAGQELAPLFQTDFQRTAIDLRTETGSLIELAVDVGSIAAAGASAPIYELELELKDGAAVDLLTAGAALAERYALLVEAKSKYARGLELLGLSSPQEGGQPEIDREASIGTLICTQGIFYLQEVMVWQENYLAHPEDPENIHQIRVKIRHLRSLLSFFKPVLPEERYADVNSILQGLAGGLGYLRELDVLTMGWQQIIAFYPDLLAGAQQLSKRLAAERDKEQAWVYKQWSGGAATPGLLRVWASLMEGLGDEEGGAGQPWRPYMERRLRKWLNRLGKELRNTDYTDRQSIHDLRIRGKKLRYVLQSFDPVLKKRYRRLLPVLKGVQDQLGLICDARRNVAIIQDLNRGRKNNALQYESGLYIGYMLCKGDSLPLGLGKQPS